MAEQDYPAIEHIVMDGVSSDGTLAILQEHAAQIDVLSSAPDAGVYDALNKGIAVATGEVVGVLHSDDEFAAPDVLSRVMDAFNTEVDAVYGDLVFIGSAGRVCRTWTAGEYAQGLFLRGWMPPHPTVFMRRNVFDRFGSYRTDMALSADYEFLIRAMHHGRIQMAYIPDVLARMHVGGLSTSGLESRLTAMREDWRAWQLNGVAFPLGRILLKRFGKVSQLVTRQSSA